MRETKTNALVIGAGIGGLASAALLASAGLSVTVLERQNHAGGKIRTLPSAAGPVDTGPTVLTMKPVFEALFSALGMRLEDHVELIQQKLIARHFWPDGSMLDLFDDEDRSRAAIHAFSGAASAKQFSQFCARARQLFAGFDEPIMRTPEPRLGQLAKYVISRPALLRAMAPTVTLAQLCTKSFDDPRLAQLFGRYATYVGGSPYHAPALLSLIWQAECAGVWVPRGGMAALSHALAAAAEKHGARFIYGADVQEIDVSAGRARGVTLADGTALGADCIVFNGDPRALATGLLGSQVKSVARQTARLPRALSAEVWAFAAQVKGPELAHHNVFFRAEPEPEFRALSEGKRVSDPTLYVCAMDRGLPEPAKTLERFEIIANAPPLGLVTHQEETQSCHRRTFQTLRQHGLSFSPEPGQTALTAPQQWEKLFPGSCGSLYGQSPHGTMAAFQRPVARTEIRGLYLAGGGTHPGAGVPMATLSGQHAAEAILKDRISTSPSRQTAMPGGMSTASATMAGAPSQSSPS